MPGEFNYGDYFGQDWTKEGRYRVSFYGARGWLGDMLIPSSDEASALHDAADFNRRFALFVDLGSKIRIPPHMEAERMSR